MERKIDRFDKYMIVKGLNDNKVTLKLSLSIGTLGKSRKEGRDLSDRVIEQILNNYTDLNKVWLMTGEGEMLITDYTESKATINEPTPVYGKHSETLVESQARLIRIQEQLMHNNTKLVETNSKITEQMIELFNKQGQMESKMILEEMKRDIDQIKREIKNAPAQEGVGCADVG